MPDHHCQLLVDPEKRVSLPFVGWDAGLLRECSTPTCCWPTAKPFKLWVRAEPRLRG
jgi:hypothetical protein